MPKTAKVQVEGEIKKRSIKMFWLSLLAVYGIGVCEMLSNTARSASEYCNRMKYITPNCSSSPNFVMSLTGGLLYIVIYGLPLGFMEYSHMKWTLYGYKATFSLVATKIFWGMLGFSLLIVTNNIEIPIWVSTLCLLTLIGLFIGSLAFHFAMKNKYSEDVKNGTAPKIKFLGTENAMKASENSFTADANFSDSDDDEYYDDML